MDFSALVGGALRPSEDPAAPRLARTRPVGVLPASARAVLARPQKQKRASSCLPHAVTFALEAEAKLRTGAHIELSIMDPYYGYRVLAGDWPRDVGAYPHMAEAWHRDHGTLSAEHAPYDDGAVTTWRPDPQFTWERKSLRAYLEKMPIDLDQIKAEIAVGRCVIVCHNVTRQMMTEAATTGVERGVEGISLGGHARCLVSYDDATSRMGCVNWWDRWGVRCPFDDRHTDSYSEIPYDLLVNTMWCWDLRRVMRGLDVEVA